MLADGVPFNEGFAAGKHVAASGVPVTAFIKGRFEPVQGGDDMGMFYVMRSSLPIYERFIAHCDVLEFWRGFVGGFEDGRV